MGSALFAIFLCMAQLIEAQQTVPNFRLKNLENETVRFEKLKGEKLTVIDFWATWCKPCIKSIPKLVALNDIFEEKGVQFIGISVDGPRNQAKVKPFARSKGIDYPVLLDINKEVMSRLRVQVVPTLLIVNSEKEIVHYIEGYQPGEEKIIRKKISEQLES